MAEKALGVLMGTSLTKAINAPLQQKANSVPGCVRKSIARRLMEGILPASSVQMGHTWRAGFNSDFPRAAKTWTYWGIPRAMKMIKGLDYLACEKRLGAGTVECEEKKTQEGSL